MRHQIYEVTFAGEAGATVCAAFDDCEITAGPEMTTVRAELPDQAAVMGLLRRITSLGLELIEMHRVATQAGARNEWPPPARRGLPARGRAARAKEPFRRRRQPGSVHSYSRCKIPPPCRRR
jgi:hypothetical protein